MTKALKCKRGVMISVIAIKHILSEVLKFTEIVVIKY